jgi:hypothetical protein
MELLMILPILLLVANDSPTLEQARTCKAHMESMIDEVAREGAPVAGPTWFIRDWWTLKAVEAGAPDDDRAALAAATTRLEAIGVAEPEKFRAERQACVDTAIEAGAVPGMGPG